MPAQPLYTCSEQDYLAFERAAETKSEFILASIGCVLPLSEVYLDVTFTPSEPEEAPNPDAA